MSDATTTALADFPDAASLPAEVQRALVEFVMALADTKHIMGLRLSEWVTCAPAMEAAVAAANITQEELGHARSLFAMIRGLPGAPEQLNTDTDRSRSTYQNPAILNAPFSTWCEIVAMLLLFDSALAVAVATAADSRLKPLRQRIAKMQQEEHFHRVFAEGWVRRLTDTSQAMRENLQQALNRTWPAASGWIGPARYEGGETLCDAGILARSPGQDLEAWQARLSGFVGEHGLNLPPCQPYWSAWNSAKRELPDVG